VERLAVRRSGLGRGLESLIPGLGQDAGAGIATADIDALEPNPLQPRARWDDDQLEALAASIREHGIIQPIIVSRRGSTKPFQIIAGERRWRAARRAGLSSVPVLVREATAAEILELALVENVQRADLNPIEEALAFRHLIDEFGLTQSEIAGRVGMSRPAIANALRLLSAPQSIQDAVLGEQISAGHAKALLSIADAEAQARALDAVIRGGLSVRDTEKLAQAVAKAPRTRPRIAPSDPDLDSVMNDLRRHLGTRVDLNRSRGGGKIVIHFHSDDELNAVLSHILGTDDDL
jgi:ParB family chromosome partitioning protein